MSVEAIAQAAENLPKDRRELLDVAVLKIREVDRAGDVNLLAVCTHNSRRSQLCQAWATVAAAHYGVKDVDCYSCGTEATACNPRTVAALQRAGWLIEPRKGDSTNPKYKASFGEQSIAVELWSKAFGDKSLPSQQIVALMCCDEADAACPNVPGARARVALHYVDPKVSDGQPNEAATYDERSQQIAAEMFYLMRAIK